MHLLTVNYSNLSAVAALLLALLVSRLGLSNRRATLYAPTILGVLGSLVAGIIVVALTDFLFDGDVPAWTRQAALSAGVAASLPLSYALSVRRPRDFSDLYATVVMSLSSVFLGLDILSSSSGILGSWMVRLIRNPALLVNSGDDAFRDETLEIAFIVISVLLISFGIARKRWGRSEVVQVALSGFMVSQLVTGTADYFGNIHSARWLTVIVVAGVLWTFRSMERRMEWALAEDESLLVVPVGLLAGIPGEAVNGPEMDVALPENPEDRDVTRIAKDNDTSAPGAVDLLQRHRVSNWRSVSKDDKGGNPGMAISREEWEKEMLSYESEWNVKSSGAGEPPKPSAVSDARWDGDDGPEWNAQPSSYDDQDGLNAMAAEISISLRRRLEEIDGEVELPRQPFSGERNRSVATSAGKQETGMRLADLVPQASPAVGAVQSRGPQGSVFGSDDSDFDRNFDRSPAKEPVTDLVQDPVRDLAPQPVSDGPQEAREATGQPSRPMVDFRKYTDLQGMYNELLKQHQGLMLRFQELEMENLQLQDEVVRLRQYMAGMVSRSKLQAMHEDILQVLERTRREILDIHGRLGL